jgi:hypothetical protein
MMFNATHTIQKGHSPSPTEGTFSINVYKITVTHVPLQGIIWEKCFALPLSRP